VCLSLFAKTFGAFGFRVICCVRWISGKNCDALKDVRVEWSVCECGLLRLQQQHVAHTRASKTHVRINSVVASSERQNHFCDEKFVPSRLLPIR